MGNNDIRYFLNNSIQQLLEYIPATFADMVSIKYHYSVMVISILTVAECDENTFQSRTKYFSGHEWTQVASV